VRDNRDLDAAAVAPSSDMVAADYFDHTSPSGVTFTQRILNTGYATGATEYMFGENLAIGTLQLATPEAIVTGWMNSPEHRADILTPDFRDSAIGVVSQVPRQFASGEPAPPTPKTSASSSRASPATDPPVLRSSCGAVDRA
jgi:uncharacterized protein YkwD